jgi:hypothetical protein
MPESIGLVLRRPRPGSLWSARVAAFARCDLGGDHAPGDRLAAWQLPEPRRGRDDDAEPAAADIPSRRCGRRCRSAPRGTAAIGPRDARCQRRQPGAVVFPRAAARQSAPRPGSGRSPRQHEHVRRAMTTVTARQSSVLPPLPCQRESLTQAAASPVAGRARPAGAAFRTRCVPGRSPRRPGRGGPTRPAG